MKNNLATAVPAQECRDPDDSPLRLVIAYDDLAAYRHALRAVAYLVPKARTGGTHISPRLWRFDALAQADSRFRAVAEIGRAHV